MASKTTTGVNIASLRNHSEATLQRHKWTLDTKDKETHGEQMARITQIGPLSKQLDIITKFSANKEGALTGSPLPRTNPEMKALRDSWAQESKNLNLCLKEETKNFSQPKGIPQKLSTLHQKFKLPKSKISTQRFRRNTTTKGWHRFRKAKLTSVNKVELIQSFERMVSRTWCIAIKVCSQSCQDRQSHKVSFLNIHTLKRLIRCLIPMKTWFKRSRWEKPWRRFS